MESGRVNEKFSLGYILLAGLEVQSGEAGHKVV